MKKFLVLIPVMILIIIHIISFIYQKKVKNNNKELVKSKKELERERHLRSSISKLTHELKNPLAVINGYLGMFDLEDIDKSSRYLKIIKSEVARSLTIINDFSNYGKLKELELEEVDMSILLEDIKDVLDPLFIKNESLINIKVPDETYLLGDYNRLKQVLLNITKNSLEAKKEHEKLEVNISSRKYKNNIITKIKDNGKGMNKETLKRVFELFYTTKENGTGIGVAYSKEVIQLHNGTVEYKSTENIGTEVIITIPKEKSP